MKSAFSHAVYENKKEVDIFDVENAILNTKLVYPDVIKKDMPNFYERFKDIIKEEKENLNNPKPVIEEIKTPAPEIIEETTHQEEVEVLDLMPEEDEVILDRKQYHKPEERIFSELDNNIISNGIEELEENKEDKKAEPDNLFDDFFEQ